MKRYRMFEKTAKVLSAILIFLAVVFASPAHASIFSTVAHFFSTPVSVPQTSSTASSTNSMSISKYLSIQSSSNVVAQHVLVADTSSTHGGAVGKVLGAYTQASATRFVSIDQFVKSLYILENRLNAKINSSGGGGSLTVPPEIFVQPAPNLSVLSPTTLTVSGNATSTFANGIDIASGCFSIAGTCITTGGGTWGSITGTLSAQTDLQSALDAKLSLSAWFSTTTAPQITTLANLATIGHTGATSTVAGDLSVAGNVNFTGALLQNGAPFAGSQWTTSGSNIYYNTGNVGIGNTNPTNPLSVTGTAGVGIAYTNTSGHALMSVDGAAASQAGYYIYKGGSEKAQIAVLGNSNDLTFSMAGTPRLTVAAGGNVGIGTTNPGAPLDFAASVGSKIGLYNGQNFGIGIQSSLLQLYVPSTAARVGIGYGSSGSFTETLSVAGDNVGIGTISPGAKLNVAGGVAIGSYSSAPSNSLTVSGNVGVGTNNPGAKLSFGTTFGVPTEYFYEGGTGNQYGLGIQSGEVQFFNPSGGHYSFNTGGGLNSSGTNELMRIDGSGNVGIGTSSPGGKLHIYQGASGVTANAIANGLIVESSGSAGISLLGPNNQEKYIAFGSPSSNLDGLIRYAPTGGLMQFQTSSAGLQLSNGQLRGGNGTALTPAYSFINGSNVGIFLDSGNTDLGITTAGSERMRITGTGNVGIGTTNPGYLLTMKVTKYNNTQGFVMHTSDGSGFGSGTGSLLLHPAEASGYGTLDFLNDTGSVINALTAAGLPTGKLLLQVNGGNVGIGTANPQGLLNIEKSSYASNALLINDGVTGAPPSYTGGYKPALSVVSDQTGGAAPLFLGYNNSGTWNAELMAAACGSFSRMCLSLGAGSTLATALEYNSGSLLIGGGDNGNFGTVDFKNGGPTIFESTGNTTFAGNVGINVVSPSYKLDVAGSAAVTRLLGKNQIQTANDELYFGDTTMTNVFLDRELNGGQFIVGFNTPQSNAAFSPFSVYNNSSNHTILLQTQSAGSGGGSSNGVFLLPNGGGNVGIGTSSPYAKLSVVGTVVAANFISTTTATSTFAGPIKLTGTPIASNAGSLLQLGTDFTLPNSLGTFLSINASASSLDPIFVQGANNNIFRLGSDGEGLNLAFGEYSSASGRSSVAIGSQAVAFQSQTVLSGTNVIFQIGGSEKMRVDSSGNVGIGTTSPYKMLSVAGDIVGTNITATGTVTVLGALNGTGVISSPAGFYSNFNSSGTFTVDNNGLNIGAANASLPSGVVIISTGDSGNNPGLIIKPSPSATTQNVAYLQTQDKFGNPLSTLTSTGGATFAGNVGIGTTTPWAQLSVNPNGIGSGPEFAIGSSTKTDLVVANNGNVGINVVSPGYKLDVSGSAAVTRLLGKNQIQTANDELYFGDTTMTNVFLDRELNGGQFIVGFNTPQSNAAFSPFSVYNNSSNHTILLQTQSAGSGGGSSNGVFLLPNGGGNVGIGTSSPASTLTVTGSGCFSQGAGVATVACDTTAGTISYKTANSANVDLAENYKVSDQSISAGDIVMLDATQSLFVTKALAGKGETIGIVSTAPGVLLGGSSIDLQGPNVRPIALAGRVPVKFSNENGEVKIGDELTISSTTPGVAIKAKIGGVVIGTALENMSSNGSVMVFVRSSLAQNSAPAEAQEVIDESSLGDTFTSLMAGSGHWMYDHISATTGFFKNVFANRVTTKELCVGDANDSVCITKDQLKTLLNNNQIQQASVTSSVTTSSVSTSTPATTTPVQSTATSTTTADTTVILPTLVATSTPDLSTPSVSTSTPVITQTDTSSTTPTL